MAKVSFTKLGLKINQEVKTIDFNEQIIEVKQYLPVNDKLELISNIINESADDNNFANPTKVHVYSIINILEAYTNINLTEKQKENPAKLYDMLVSSDLMNKIIQAIPAEEYESLLKGIAESIEAVYKYRNSMLGMLETITTDYSQLDLDATKIRDKIGDPENLALLKDIMTKLG